MIAGFTIEELDTGLQNEVPYITTHKVRLGIDADKVTQLGDLYGDAATPGTKQYQIKVPHYGATKGTHAKAVFTGRLGAENAGYRVSFHNRRINTRQPALNGQ